MKLVDTSVFVRHLRKGSDARVFLDNHSGQIAYSYITWGELLQGVRSKAHLEQTRTLLSGHELLWGSRRIEKVAIKLLHEYTSTGMGLMDALIAATALEHDLVLVTYNTKHFKAVEGLRLETPAIK